jgi:flagellar basal-body rod protein FlgF
MQGGMFGNKRAAMPYGLYISAEGAHAQQKRMEVISNNLANVDTPGFKRDLAIFQARHAAEVANGAAAPGMKDKNDLGGGIFFLGKVTDYAPGTLKRTGIDSDFAMNGDGFFAIERDGQKHLTRAGNFMFNSNGRLITQDGDAVLSEAGTPIEIQPDLPWSFTNDGAIVQNGERFPLAVERPKELGDLSKVGENMFLPLAETDPVPQAERDMRNGYVEMSSVKPTLEMLEMIETSRAFEANLNMVKNHDAVLNSLVNRVLRTS